VRRRGAADFLHTHAGEAGASGVRKHSVSPSAPTSTRPGRP
jgi:hypothetical protein